MTVRSKLSSFLKDYSEGRKLLAGYWVFGYPDIPTSIMIMELMARSGADIVEIGFPYSDPVADGHAIQNASAIALEKGVEIESLWNAVGTIKNKTSPFLMTYGNIAFQYGIEKLYQKATRWGVEGVIFPDVPPNLFPERLKELHPAFIVSPNASPNRIKLLTKESRSFIYFLSGLATTGGKQGFDQRLENALRISKDIRKNIPALVGFGISDQKGIETALEIGFDGVIIGSALLREFDSMGIVGVQRLIEKARNILDSFEKVRAIL